jgi:hypothetical protein
METKKLKIVVLAFVTLTYFDKRMWNNDNQKLLLWLS